MLYGAIKTEITTSLVGDVDINMDQGELNKITKETGYCA